MAEQSSLDGQFQSDLEFIASEISKNLSDPSIFSIDMGGAGRVGIRYEPTKFEAREFEGYQFKATTGGKLYLNCEFSKSGKEDSASYIKNLIEMVGSILEKLPVDGGVQGSTVYWDFPSKIINYLMATSELSNLDEIETTKVLSENKPSEDFIVTVSFGYN